jgi:D-glycero-alpha-D-manno-heptose 1-phosphate guanylyltransferase
VIRYLKRQGIKHFIFSLGYKSEAFTGFIQQHISEKEYSIVIESEPLGTGGAIKFALKAAKTENVLVVNGDSLFEVFLPAALEKHIASKAACTLVLKPMKDFDRYGVVELNSDNSISLFKEKQQYAAGLINGGVYLLNKDSFLEEALPEKFSFETDYLQKLYSQRKFFGLIQEGYFIDIGIPEDYAKAQKDLTV